MAKTKILITVEGGIVQNVCSDKDCDIVIMDFDCEGSDRYKEVKVYNSRSKYTCNIYKESPEVTKELVEHYFKQAEK
jgi:hypothetical protein